MDKKTENIPQILSVEETTLALEQNFDLCEENVLQYMSGYFFKQLMKMHKGTCEICSENGEKMDSQSQIEYVSEIFLYFKRYHQSSELFKGNSLFTAYIKCIVQICTNTINNHLELDGIGAIITKTALVYLDPSPKFCCNAIKEKLISLISRTLLCHQTKWINLKNKHKENSANYLRKLEILQHK